MIKIDQGEIAKLTSLLEGGARRIVLVGHTNPDGDAVGAMLGLGEALDARGHTVTCVVPNRYPSFLDWMEGVEQVLIFKENPDAVVEAIAAAEAIFSIDFNQINRLEALGETIVSNTAAVKVLIDHHPDPPPTFDIVFSHSESSSTSYLVYNIIVWRLYGPGAITRRVAEALYVGMMTDTGNFSFGNLTSGLFRAVADMVDKGIDIPAINNRVYNSYSEGRMRLLGYVLGTKMKVIEPCQVAYITLGEDELRRFDFHTGDTEGFVNYPLIIKGMQMSAMFIENRRFIRVSLRSRGNTDVNIFARRYFDGGGHRNAAGGKSYDTMEQTVGRFLKAVEEFFANR